jgi:uncharacterized FAD-dependent dehydrogenase
VVVNLRAKLIELGCEVRFAARVTDFLMSRDKIIGVIINRQEEVRTDHLIVAVGQSADDTCRCLWERGVRMEAKPFAIGVRVEHPQSLINQLQHGQWFQSPELPPADYFLTAKIKEMDRSVYSFCMCPGGQVIGCSAESGGMLVNGMSSFHRDGVYANSAVVVNIRVDDFNGSEPLNGLTFRRQWEEKAFIQGGGHYHAPAQRLMDFLLDKDSGVIGSTSFLPGVQAASLQRVLPGFVVEALKKGFRQFDQKMPGFMTNEAHLIGVETRTSSPVRILRGPDGQSVNVKGLYPCGEGAGYAGGIISSALDGIRAAQSIP